MGEKRTYPSYPLMVVASARSGARGNYGKLLAGLVLLPAAKVDDGLQDVVTIGPKSIVGWLAVAARVLRMRIDPGVLLVRV